MPKSKPASFEDAFEELDQTIAKLEAGELTLEESIALFERGMQLAGLLEKQLEQAELRVRKLQPNVGELSEAEEDFEDEAEATE